MHAIQNMPLSYLFSRRFTKYMKTKQELFEHELEDIYFVEKELIKALPKLKAQAISIILKQLFSEHLEETKNQVNRLELIFQSLKKKPKGEKCDGFAGLKKEKEGMMKKKLSREIKDIVLISSAIKVERYELSAYETLLVLANDLELSLAHDLLKRNLEEERGAREKFQALLHKDDPHLPMMAE